MADEDEIDILGDFSFNSCFAQNNQGIPSCSDREDTVHPQWLQDAPPNNWYDTQNIARNRMKEGPSRRLSGNNATNKHNSIPHTTVWSQAEREILKQEMAKFGRNVRKISQALKTKTEPEIQALIEAEHGIQLDAPAQGLRPDRYETIGDTPTVIQEEIVTDNPVGDILSMVTTGTPTISPIFKKNKSIINSNVTLEKNNTKYGSMPTNLMVNPSEIFNEDDLAIGSTELVKSEKDMLRNLALQQKEKVKTLKKIGNHRRKVSRNYDKNRNKSADSKKSPQGRHRKDSSLSLSDDSVKSPKMHIVLGSGQALPVSEGEQVIKIEKKKDSECESDIEVDIDSDNEVSPKKPLVKIEPSIEAPAVDAPVAVPLRKFEPMPKRNRKIPLSGGGGYTIMHTAAGDLYEIGQEPRKERAPKKTPVHLIQCRLYNDDKPPPCEVHLHVSALISMDVHAHSSRAEVMGLLGGEWCAPRLLMRQYRNARAAAAATHCDMDPVSQACAAEWLRARGLAVCGWHHSHPRFPAAPSAQDLRTQCALQRALRWPLPFLALITSQHWPSRHVPSVSRLRCFRVEEAECESGGEGEGEAVPAGYQLRVRVVPDLTPAGLPPFLRELRALLAERDRGQFSVNIAEDVCPQAGLTYLEKCILSIRHHMHSAGYEHDAPLVELLVRGVRDVVR